MRSGTDLELAMQIARQVLESNGRHNHNHNGSVSVVNSEKVGELSSPQF
jgi:hypothetical protein